MVDVDVQMPAAILHEVVSNRSGMLPEGFALYYQSKQLEGEAALASWGVQKDATIEVKTRGRGGAPEADGGAAKANRRRQPWEERVIDELRDGDSFLREDSFTSLPCESEDLRGFAPRVPQVAAPKDAAPKDDGAAKSGAAKNDDEIEMVELKKAVEAATEKDPKDKKHAEIMEKLKVMSKVKAPPRDYAKGINSMTKIMTCFAVDKSKLAHGQSATVQAEGLMSITSTLCTEAPNIIALLVAAEATSMFLLPALGAVLGLVSAQLALFNVGKGGPSEQDLLINRVTAVIEQYHNIEVNAYIRAVEVANSVLYAQIIGLTDEASETVIRQVFNDFQKPLVEIITRLESYVMQQSHVMDKDLIHASIGVNCYTYIQLSYPLFERLQLGLLLLRIKPNFPLDLIRPHAVAVSRTLASMRTMVTFLTVQPIPSKLGACSIFNGYAKASQADIQRTALQAAMCSEEGNDLVAKLAEHKIFSLYSTETNSYVGLSADWSSPVSDESKAATFVAFSTTKGSALDVQADDSTRSKNIDDEVYIYCADNGKYMSMESPFGGRHYYWYANAVDPNSASHKFHLKTTQHSWAPGPPEVETGAKGHIRSNDRNARSWHDVSTDAYYLTNRKEAHNLDDELVVFFHDARGRRGSLAQHNGAIPSRTLSHTFVNEWEFSFKNITIER